MRVPSTVVKLGDYVLLFGFICMVVPLYLATITVGYGKRLWAYFDEVDAVAVATTLVTATVVALVGMQIMDKTADGIEETETLCAGLYGCGAAPPILSIADVLGLVLVTVVLLGVVRRFTDPNSERDP